MKRLWLSPYLLESVHSGEKRPGYLLKLSTPDFAAGYADIFPWPEFGDPNFPDIPRMLKDRESHPLLKQSLSFAEVDGKAREAQISLLKGHRLKNHLLITSLSQLDQGGLEEAMEQGFDRFKIKVCREKNKEVAQLIKICSGLNENQKMRLDCNALGTESFFEQIMNIKERVEYVEDPFANPTKWNIDWPLAFDQPDFAYERVNADYQIIKPAKQSGADMKAEKLVFSSYLDHPVGIAHAFYCAVKAGPQKRDYGLMSHKCHKKNVFHQGILTLGPWMSFPEDYGIGFSEVLIKQEWTEL